MDNEIENVVSEEEKALPKKPRKKAVKPTKEDEKISENITLCADGKYRWQYDVNLFKNTTVLFLILKIFLIPFAAIFVFVNVIDILKWGFDSFLSNLKIFGLVFLVLIAVVFISYLIYAAIMGGKYSVIFEMDEKGINHRQIPSQAKKAKKIAGLTAAGGAASGSLSTIGIGIAASRTEMYSEFSKVKRIKVYPRKNLIKLNETLEHNQVYAADADFEFVKNYISERCPNAKK